MVWFSCEDCGESIKKVRPHQIQEAPCSEPHCAPLSLRWALGDHTPSNNSVRILGELVCSQSSKLTSGAAEAPDSHA